MNFISEYGIKYDIIEINKFSKLQIDEFIEKIPNLKTLNCNEEILELIKNPFYLSSFSFNHNLYALHMDCHIKERKHL